MTYDEIIALSGRKLDLAVAELMGDHKDPEVGWVSEGAASCCFDGGPHCYSRNMMDAWRVAERFKLTVTPKKDATETSRWLADPELRGKRELWLGHGPTAAIAICRAALLIANKGKL